MSNQLTITEQINSQYRSYALYVLQSRGIPNYYDGLTPVQRLILEHAPKNYNKTLGLVGDVIRTGLYHHSDDSLSGSVSKLARPFGCSFQVLEGDGFFGSPVNPNPSAPRYTSVRMNPKISDAIKKHDDLNEVNGEGAHDWLHVEFPIGLLTHVVGIAVGYRSNVLPRKYEDIIEYISGANKVLKPHFKDFGGKVSKYGDGEKTWLLEGGFEQDAAKRIIKIWDLPPLLRYENFISRLNAKLDLMGYDYEMRNKSQSTLAMEIVFRGVTPKEFAYITEGVKKLTQIVVTEDIVLIKDGKVVQYQSIKEYLDSFRSHYQLVKLKRLQKDLDVYTREIEYLRAKLSFLQYMAGPKRKNTEIQEFIGRYEDWINKRLSKLELIKLSDDSIKKTQDEIKELEKLKAQLIKDVKAQEKIWKEVSKNPGKNTAPKKAAALFDSTSIIEQKFTSEGIEIFQIEAENAVIDEEESEEI